MSIPLENMATFWNCGVNIYAKENIFNHNNKRI